MNFDYYRFAICFILSIGVHKFMTDLWNKLVFCVLKLVIMFRIGLVVLLAAGKKHMKLDLEK